MCARAFRQSTFRADGTLSSVRRAEEIFPHLRHTKGTDVVGISSCRRNTTCRRNNYPGCCARYVAHARGIWFAQQHCHALATKVALLRVAQIDTSLFRFFQGGLITCGLKMPYNRARYEITLFDCQLEIYVAF